MITFFALSGSIVDYILHTGSLIYSIVTHPVAALTGSALIPVIGAPIATKLLTDKKVLDLAIKFAETGTEKAAVKFNVRMKQITGYTPVTLARETSKLKSEEQKKNSTNLKKKLTKHTKPNKKKPNDQALEKLLDTPDSKKAAEVFRSNPWD